MFDKSKLEFSTPVEGVVNAKYTDKDVYYNSTDIPKEMLKKVAEHNNNYITKATELASAEAKSLMQKEDSVNRVVAEFPFGTNKYGNVAVAVDREKTFTNTLSKDKETIRTSKVRVVVSDPVHKPSKSLIKEIEQDLSEHLLK